MTYVLGDRVGSIELTNHMGTDLEIAEAAWTSRRGLHEGTDQEIRRVLGFMMRNGHTSPFEMVELKFIVTAPIFVVRQWHRHRTWSYNEESRRYTDGPVQLYYPQDFRMRDPNNKQGSIVSALSWIELRDMMQMTCENAAVTYARLLGAGVAPEVARMVLPVNMYTTFYAKVDLHNLMKFVQERSHKNAQWEIRQYSDEILRQINVHYPIVGQLFVERLRKLGGYDLSGYPGAITDIS